MEDTKKLSDQQMESVAGGMISEEEALANALAHVKLSEDQVDYIKGIELDYERGRKVYEVEFFKDGFEFEFDIDAETGHVLKYKKKRD